MLHAGSLRFRNDKSPWIKALFKYGTYDGLLIYPASAASRINVVLDFGHRCTVPTEFFTGKGCKNQNLVLYVGQLFSKVDYIEYSSIVSILDPLLEGGD